MLSDELIRAACEGDVDARKRVVLRLCDLLKPIVARSVPDHDQEDVLHEALQAIMVKMGAKAPRTVSEFERWAQGFAGKQVQIYWGGLEREAGRKVGYVLAEQARPRTTWFAKQWQERQHWVLGRFLRQLTTRFRGPIEHRLRGGSDRSYAKKRDMPMATVRSHRARGYRRLREMFVAYLAEGTSSRVSPTPS